MERLLDWFGLPAADRARVRVVEGEIGRPGLGIDPATRGELLATIDEIIHCASSTSFAERRRAEVEAANLVGMSRVLDFAAAGRAAAFHHISTAYVAGKVTGRCPEQPVTGREFHNVYEETKCRAEHMALSACRDAGITLTIHRPSIVYGDSRTGRSLIFNAVYYPVRTAVFIRDLYRNDIRERGGRKAAQMGVRIEADGKTFLPLRVEVAERGGIDLIPVDHFTSAFMALRENAPGGGIFHIVSGRLTPIEDLVEYSRRLFDLAGIRVCRATDSRNPLETLFDHCLEAYEPYMRDTRVFATGNARPILEARGLACPEFDYESFRRCMSYAVEVDWGTRLFPE